MVKSSQVALQVVQQAIAVLAKWANFEHPILDHEYSEVEKAKEILNWTENTKIGTLRLLFDSIKLPNGKGQDPNKKHYHPLIAIENQPQEYPNIPYPLDHEPNKEQIASFKQKIKDEVLPILKDNWENLSLLMLILEKFGSCLSFGESDVALVDMVNATSAVAAALVNHPEGENINLIVGDLSGIQKFIYTISSDGALKSLRARSFYLELVTEEVVQQLLDKLELPRTNVIYAGGGNLYILASGKKEVKSVIKEVRQQFNEWLLREFEGKVFLALDCLCFSTSDLKPEPKSSQENSQISKFAENWSNATKNLAVHKSQKFCDQISDLIKPRYSHEPCRVCHRDDVEPDKLKLLNDNEPDSVLACETCRSMFDLGSQLFKVNAIVRSQQKNIANALHTLSFSGDIYYHLFENWKQIDPTADMVLLVNDWTLEHYQFKHFKNVYPLLLGNYGKQGKLGFMRAEEMAEQAKGIKRFASLRMDVDRLGQIFAKGLGENQTLPRLAGLSRQMSYFFKVYLNSLASKINVNIPENIKQLLPKDEPYNILFIYAGGDDLFISGAWNEVVNFAFDVYQCFRAYTGYNPDITLSGGVSIDTPKFPLYQAAKSSGHAEDAAKGNGRNSLGLFGQVFKWDEWLGIEDINDDHLDSDIKKYLSSENKPEFLGILPFVEILEKENIGVNYSRNFVRNLLITAQIQEQALEKFNDQKTQEALGTRYYLHLPKIAYTLSRLSKEVLKNDDFRTSLKSPYNAPYFRAIATWIELLNRG